ncbi:MAG: hypothetical protein COB50_01900 [Thiotrichales bacterium]|nr:MAG: hypothetical protein COB50_01900 [Thiotrichales bacterium]
MKLTFKQAKNIRDRSAALLETYLPESQFHNLWNARYDGYSAIRSSFSEAIQEFSDAITEIEDKVNHKEDFVYEQLDSLVLSILETLNRVLGYFTYENKSTSYESCANIIQYIKKNHNENINKCINKKIESLNKEMESLRKYLSISNTKTHKLIDKVITATEKKDTSALEELVTQLKNNMHHQNIKLWENKKSNVTSTTGNLENDEKKDVIILNGKYNNTQDISSKTKKSDSDADKKDEKTVKKSTSVNKFKKKFKKKKSSDKDSINFDNTN